MSLKQQIIDAFKDKNELTLKEIYANVGSSKSGIRAIINLEVKKGLTFERINKEVYKLR